MFTPTFCARGAVRCAKVASLLRPGQATPAPWVNVIANPGFGFLVAGEGGGYTWSGNSRENQLTPWSNDPVTNRSGEAFYLRDADTQAMWCPTAMPRRDPAATYVVRHGRGYSRFDRVAHGIASSLVQYVPTDDPVKLSRLRLQNLSGQARTLTRSAYVDWVLGASRTATAAFVTTGMDVETGCQSRSWAATRLSIARRFLPSAAADERRVIKFRTWSRRCATSVSVSSQAW